MTFISIWVNSMSWTWSGKEKGKSLRHTLARHWHSESWRDFTDMGMWQLGTAVALQC